MTKNKKPSLFNEIVKHVKKKNDYAFTLDEDNPYEVKEWIDTGCYILNAIMSNGDIYKGFPTGKRIVISGLESTVKSLLTMLMVKKYVDKKPNSKIIFFETEGSSTVDIAKNIGIKSDQMIILPIITVEECRNQMVQILNQILDDKFGYITKTSEKTGKKTRKKIKDFKPVPENERENFIFVLDSLGMLGTEKENNDAMAGSNTKDMTRAQLIKGFARVISLKLSIIQAPFIVVNHLYATFDKYNPFTSSGGTGVKYFADISLQNTKSKQKEGTEQIGIILKLKTEKSRYMQENKSVKVMINFKKGLYKYSGLIDIISELGIFKKEGYSWVMPDGTKETMKKVRENISKYMTKINLDAIRESIIENFSFGTKGFINEEDTDMDNNDIDATNNIMEEVEEFLMED